MTVLPPQPGAVGGLGAGAVRLRCPALKVVHPSVLLPAVDGTHFALTNTCRLFVLDDCWSRFLQSGLSTEITGKVVELVNPPLATLVARLRGLAPLDSLFGPGASAAAEIIASDPRLGIAELRKALAGSGPAEKRNRAQALVVLPLLRYHLADSGEAPSERRAAVTAVVDQGKPLLRELPRILNCKPWVIRHLCGKVAQQIEPYSDMAVDLLVEHMEWITPERAPQGYGQFNLLSVLSSEAFDPHKAHSWIVGAIRRSVLRSGWPEFGTRFNDLESICDYACFVEHLARGMTRYTDDIAEAVDVALGRPTLKQVEDLATRWHDIEERIRTELRPALGLVAPGSWKPLFEDEPEFRGYRMRCLRTRQELDDEGQELKHCVSNYFSACEAGACHIVGITLGGERIATAELRLIGRSKRNRKLTVRQVSGWRNVHPEREVVDAVQDLVTLLEQRDLSEFPSAEDAEVPQGNGPVWLLERVLELEGPAGLDRYRACLQPNARHSGLWDHVAARCRSGRLAQVEEMSRFEARIRSIAAGLGDAT